jgi:hypothetical protein
MNILLRALAKTGLLKGDLDCHLIRASMVVIYFFSDIRSGLITKHKASFRSLRMVLSSSGCTRPSASKEPLIF